MVSRSSRTELSILDTQIISTVKKPIPVKELLARLQKLADLLSAVDQNNVSPDSYKQIARDLSNKKLLRHLNAGVQALSCCAIADILRIYAPDAPYTPEELSFIFSAFFAQFSHLWDEGNAYFLQQSYILKRIVEVRSIILVADLPDAPSLISTLFDTMYSLASKGFPSKLEPIAADMLSEIITEADSVPKDVVTLVLKKLTTALQKGLTSSLSNISNPGFAFSLAVCEANVDKLSRLVAQLFSEMLDESAASTEEGEIDYEASYQILEKIHSWSVQIWRNVPDLLASVMGLINDELNSDSEQIRVLATTTIGDMISSSLLGFVDSNVAYFVNKHKNTWNLWLKKNSDVSFAVRAKWVEQVASVLASTSVTTEMANDLGNGLIKCLRDTHDRVRFEACKVIESLPFHVFTNRLCKADVLSTLLQLTREKNGDIRSKAIRISANIYDNFLKQLSKHEVTDFGSLNNDEVQELEKIIITDTPNTLLLLNYINDKAVNASVDAVLFERLLPFEDDADKRVERLCKFYGSLDERSKAVFVASAKRQRKMSETVDQLIKISQNLAPMEKGNAKIDHDFTERENLLLKSEKIIQWLSVSFPPNFNTVLCLEKFVNLKNSRFLNLLSICNLPNSDYKSVKNSMKELLGKLNDPKSIKNSDEFSRVGTADMLSNIKILLYRSATIIFNKSNITELLKISRADKHAYTEISNELIGIVSSISPEVFGTHIKTITDVVINKGLSVDLSFLRSFYHLLKTFPHEFPDRTEATEQLKDLAVNGTPLQAKYALKVIGCSESKEQLISEIRDEIFPLESKSPLLGTRISTLAEIYLIDPVSLEQYSNEINSVIVDNVLRCNRMDDSQYRLHLEDKWIDDAELYQEKNILLAEKLASLRLVLNRVRAIADTISDFSLLEKPLRLFLTIISNSGEIVKVKDGSTATPNSFQKRLRLYSGEALLKLAKYANLDLLISFHVVSKLGKLVHDESKEVREQFLKKLKRYLASNEISEKFLHLVFFVGHDPDGTLRNDVLTWTRAFHKRCQSKSDIVFERNIVRLIHAISHDERFRKLVSDAKTSPRDEDAQIMGYVYGLKFFTLYLDAIASEQNVSLLYYFASRVKQYRDSQVAQDLYTLEDVPEEILNLYRVAELCQLMIKELADSKSWNLQTYPGKLKLPSDIFAPMEDFHEAQRTISRVYISDDVQIELRLNFKKMLGSGISKRKATTKPATQKRQRSGKPRQAIRRRKTGKRNIASDEEPEHQVLAPNAIRRSTRAVSKVRYEETGSSDAEEEKGSNLSD